MRITQPIAIENDEISMVISDITYRFSCLPAADWVLK